MAAIINSSIDDLIAYIGQYGGRASKAVNDQMSVEALNIYTEIKARMPVDYGNLEDSLTIESNLRKQWAVFVDTGHAGHGDASVGDYAAWLNESSDYQLGEKSLAKGSEVGPKFMERGLQAVTDDGAVSRIQGVLNDAWANH